MHNNLTIEQPLAGSRTVNPLAPDRQPARIGRRSRGTPATVTLPLRPRNEAGDRGRRAVSGPRERGLVGPWQVFLVLVIVAELIVCMAIVRPAEAQAAPSNPEVACAIWPVWEMVLYPGDAHPRVRPALWTGHVAYRGQYYAMGVYESELAANLACDAL